MNNVLNGRSFLNLVYSAHSLFGRTGIQRTIKEQVKQVARKEVVDVLAGSVLS